MDKSELRTKFLDFFNKYPKYVPPHKGFEEVNEAWNAFFIFYFGSMPKDSEVKPKDWRPYWPSGSTDPRWDELLHRDGGLTVFRELEIEIKEKKLKTQAA